MADQVLVGVDDSASAMDAVQWGAREAARRRVPLRLVHVYWTPGWDFPEFELTGAQARVEMWRLGTELLDRAARAATEAEQHVSVETEIRTGDPRVVLLDECRHASLAVLGSRQLSAAGGLLVGSLGLALAVHGRCPLVVVRGAAAERGPVLVGVDGSPANSVVLDFAFAEAALAGAPLTVVRTWSGIPADAAAEHERERQALEDQISPWRERFPDVPVDQVVVRGRPGPVLLDYGQHARLIVVGSRGHGAVTGLLLGSTSQRLTRHAPCPVAIVRSDVPAQPPAPDSRAP
ncbi:universal stress protein [Amycolatopsis taiwanensis]|uniref:Universal stress protein n=1 Tax=Amycolatopsis taiwanensis TaxID=342230 RepID=A0A9W6QZR9_9PSEU|nr:universal stress protein [Amycolatopsis taiwanensis]GLY66971.1 universal stress protein [Amycolatopsis taiwanensis]